MCCNPKEKGRSPFSPCEHRRLPWNSTLNCLLLALLHASGWKTKVQMSKIPYSSNFTYDLASTKLIYPLSILKETWWLHLCFVLKVFGYLHHKLLWSQYPVDSFVGAERPHVTSISWCWTGWKKCGSWAKSDGRCPQDLNPLGCSEGHFMSVWGVEDRRRSPRFVQGEEILRGNSYIKLGYNSV